MNEGVHMNTFYSLYVMGNKKSSYWDEFKNFEKYVESKIIFGSTYDFDSHRPEDEWHKMEKSR